MYSDLENSFENFHWRRQAKVVGIIDLILAIVDCYVVILVLVICTTTLHNEVWDLHKDEWVVILIIGLCTLCGVAVSGLELWAAATLIGSTLIGRNPQKALSMALFWRNMDILFILLLFFCVGTNIGLEFTLSFSWIYILMIGIGVASIVIRCVFFYVVFKYCQELRARCDAAKN